MGRLDGQIAVVTGATSGLGTEIASVFVSEGARVVVTGRNADRGEAVATSLGDAATFVAADLGTEAGCHRVIHTAVERFGGLTVLVNNAVLLDGDGPIAEVGGAAWLPMLAANVAAIGWLCAEAIPVMEAGGHGSIVNVSSRTAERASPRLAVYTACKGAMNALTRSITLDYARRGIRCNTVQPGYIVHESRDARNTPERWAEIERMSLTRLTTANDVAWACVYFASPESQVVSGVTLQVDGGSNAARARTLD